MVYELAGDIEELVHEHAGAFLRSIVVYTADNYEIRFVRDDVEENYDATEIERALDELRLETLEREYINSIFAEKHGEFISNILTFTEAVEMNFLVDEGVGMAIAVDREYFEQRGCSSTTSPSACSRTSRPRFRSRRGDSAPVIVTHRPVEAPPCAGPSNVPSVCCSSSGNSSLAHSSTGNCRPAW
ncbi:hypothetical protein [Halospeciosus flavus]|uniref:hypothetical protein n=1 Tax=Halospeciosus flavus TaxID=3032283 RepID=UPI003622378F